MTLRLPILLATLLFAAPSWGANALEALRASSATARQEASALRAEQLKRRSELSVLSAEIEEMKRQTTGKLLRRSDLNDALQKSQELSGVLAELGRQLTNKEALVESTSVALLEGITAEMHQLRNEFDRQSDRGTRRALIARLRELRSERDALRQSLPPARVPALLSVHPSDDPEELLEQADLLRDSEEKLRRDLKALETRIAERREEVELDRRVQRFLGEESMFDDADRRLRVQRTITDSAPSAKAEAAGPQAFGNASPDVAPSRNEQSDGTPAHVITASDARVQVGDARPLNLDADDVSTLEKERAHLEQLAKQAAQKAKELELRAAELK